MKNILITGGSGFIGSFFNEKLSEHKIVNYDLRPPIFETENLFVQGDVVDEESLTKTVVDNNIDTIIHLAAAHHDFGISEEKYFEVNELGTEIVSRVASNNGVKDIVFYSSVAVYGDNKEPSNEQMEPEPANHYGASKLAGEVKLREWSKTEGNSAIVIRPCLVYGPRNTANMYNLIKQIDSGKFFNVGQGNNIKSISFVENIVEGTIYLMNNINEAGCHLFNYADNPQLSSKKTANHIAKCLGKRQPISIPKSLLLLGAIPFDILIKITGKNLPVSTARVKKFATETFHKADKIRNAGFKPSYDNLEGLEKMVNWYKEQK